jgi:hypothetical protein
MPAAPVASPSPSGMAASHRPRSRTRDSWPWCGGGPRNRRRCRSRNRCGSRNRRRSHIRARLRSPDLRPDGLRSDGSNAGTGRGPVPGAWTWQHRRAVVARWAGPTSGTGRQSGSRPRNSRSLSRSAGNSRTMSRTTGQQCRSAGHTRTMAARRNTGSHHPGRTARPHRPADRTTGATHTATRPESGIIGVPDPAASAPPRTRRADRIPSVGVDVHAAVAAAPAAAPVGAGPAPQRRGSDRNADAEHKPRHQPARIPVAGQRRIIDRRHICIRPRAVDLRGIVARDVDDVRIGRVDDDVLLARIGGAGRRRRCRLGAHDLLWRRLQRAGGLRPRPQALDRIEHLGRLVLHRVPELLGPFELLIEHLQHLRERNQRFHRRVPGLVAQRVL